MLRDMHEIAQILNAKKNIRNQRYGVTLASKLLRIGSYGMSKVIERSLNSVCSTGIPSATGYND